MVELPDNSLEVRAFDDLYDVGDFHYLLGV